MRFLSVEHRGIEFFPVFPVKNGLGMRKTRNPLCHKGFQRFTILNKSLKFWTIVQNSGKKFLQSFLEIPSRKETYWSSSRCFASARALM